MACGIYFLVMPLQKYCLTCTVSNCLSVSLTKKILVVGETDSGCNLIPEHLIFDDSIYFLCKTCDIKLLCFLSLKYPISLVIPSKGYLVSNGFSRLIWRSVLSGATSRLLVGKLHIGQHQVYWLHECLKKLIYYTSHVSREGRFVRL